MQDAFRLGPDLQNTDEEMDEIIVAYRRILIKINV